MPESKTPASKEPTIVKVLRWTGLVEGVSYLLLVLVAMPLKYFLNQPAAVSYVGMAHGWLFLAYVALVIFAWIEMKWSFLRTVWLFVASLLPFGTFITDHQLRREYSKPQEPQ